MAASIRFGGYQGDNSVHTRGARVLVDAVDRLSNGARKVDFHQNIVTQVELRLEDDPPPPRAAPATLEGVADVHAEDRGCDGMGRARSRRGEQLATDDLADRVRRKSEKILVRGPFT